MKKIYNFQEFVNEAKKQWTDEERVMDGVKNILDGSFAFAKKPQYKYDKKGFPTEVTFMVDKEDYKLDWKDEPLKTDYDSEIVALKHVFEVALNFKNKEEKDDKMYMTFTIKHKRVAGKEKLPKWRKEVKEKGKKNDGPPNSNDDKWYKDDDEDEDIDKKGDKKFKKNKIIKK